MKTLAFAAYPMLPKLIESVPDNTGEDERAGERLAAVALLQALPNPDLLSWLATRLEKEQPFLAYQAALALLVAVRTLETIHRPTLINAIKQAMVATEGKQYAEGARRILDDAGKELNS